MDHPCTVWTTWSDRGVCIGAIRLNSAQSAFEKQLTTAFLSWTLSNVLVCLKHACFLVSSCPSCRIGVSIQDIVQRRCDACGADLADAASDSIQDEPFGSFTQRTIQTWWGMATPPEKHPAWILPEQPASVLYLLFEWLMNSIKIIGKSKHLPHSIERPPERLATQMMAFKALVNWPQGFCEFLRDWLEREALLHNYRYRYRIYKPMNLRCSSPFPFWVSGFRYMPEFSFIREAVDQFLVENGIQVHFDCLGRCTRISVEADEKLQQIARRAAQRGIAHRLGLPELWGEAVSTLKQGSQKLCNGSKKP